MNEKHTVILAPDYLTDPTSVSLCIWTIIGLFNKLVKRERNYTKTISWHFLMDSKESRICYIFIFFTTPFVTMQHYQRETILWFPCPFFHSWTAHCWGIKLRTTTRGIEENSCTLAATENKKNGLSIINRVDSNKAGIVVYRSGKIHVVHTEHLPLKNKEGKQVTDKTIF